MFLKFLRSFAGIAVLAVCSPAVFAQDTQRLYLSGHGKDDAVPWDFQCTSGAQSGFWTNLPVPSQWDVLGFGTLNYKKDLTNAWNEQGLYARSFPVPAAWSGQRVFLVFDGVMTDTAAQWNGQSVGPVHQGSFYRFKYEVTPLVKFGETNRLDVNVSKHSANKSVNDAERLADFWVFGGIFRPVYLEAVPAQFIERVAINARGDGEFSMDVFLDGVTAADSVEASVKDSAGKIVGETFRASIAASAKSVTLTARFNDIKPWTAETPNLYSVEVSLKQGGEIRHRMAQRFGFRTMEVRDGDGLYVNGRRVILKGANRHSFWPESGRCLSEAVHRLDIETLKDANMNAVRMSHYPPDEQFLDLCDELGIYVLDELAGWHHHYDNEVGAKLVREMVVRDVNHPCILFWDNGNEGGFNRSLDPLFGELDPQQRRVLHPWEAFNGVNTGHYLLYDEAVQAAQGLPIYYHGNGKTFADTNDTGRYIYMPTEFMHGLFDGGAGAGLDDYWRMMSASKFLGGGFIWVLTDDGVKRPDTREIDVAGNQAPDGIVGPYRQREGSFYAIKEIWSPIQVIRDGEATFKVQNHYSFTDARQCQFTAELRWLGNPDTAKGRLSSVPAVVEVPAIAPGGTGTVRVRLPRTRTQPDVLALRVNNPQGRELWTWTWPLTTKNRATALYHEPAEQRAVPTETAEAIRVTAGGLTVAFSKQTGLLTEVQRNGQAFSLTNGPLPAVGGATLTKLTWDQDGPDAVVSAKFSGAMKSVFWRVNGNGWVQCDYKYEATGTNDYFGVLFDYPEHLVKHKRWLGDGPFRVWKNRQRGVTLDVWENDYNDTLAGYRGWNYPEFKGFFANVRWFQLQTAEGQLTVVNNNNAPFVQIFPPAFPPTNLVGKAFARVPGGGLGLLDGIPPIGSKFKDANTTGPQGQPTIGRGEYSGSVSFYFGKL